MNILLLNNLTLGLFFPHLAFNKSKLSVLRLLNIHKTKQMA